MDHEKEDDRPGVHRISSLNVTNHTGDSFSCTEQYNSLVNLVFNEKQGSPHPSRQVVENENTGVSAIPKPGPQNHAKPLDHVELHTKQIPGAFEISGTRTSAVRRISLSSTNCDPSQNCEDDSGMFLIPKADLVEQQLKDVEAPSNDVARSSMMSVQLTDIPVAIVEKKEGRCFLCCTVVGILSITGLLVAVVSLLVQSKEGVAIPMASSTTEPVSRPTLDPNSGGVLNDLSTTSPTDPLTLIDNSDDTGLDQAEPDVDLSREPTTAPSPEPSTTAVPVSTPGPTRTTAANPTPSLTRNPTRGPTRNPTQSPTRRPTPNPTRRPTPNPTPRPTRRPPNGGGGGGNSNNNDGGGQGGGGGNGGNGGGGGGRPPRN